jgi:uncharacterized membrane protein YhfC
MVSTLALVSIAMATLLVAILPIALYWGLRKPMALERRDAIIGIAVFAFFAMIVERAINGYLLGINQTTAAWLARPAAFVVYGVFAAGICEEVGRYIGMRFIARRAPARVASDAPALGYGLGHGGAEAWLVGVLAQVPWIVYGVLAIRGELYSHLANAPADVLLRVHLILARMSLTMAAIFTLERMAALVFQVALSFLMWRGMRAGWRAILPIAIVAHAAIDVPAAMFQARLLPLAAVDGIYGIAALLLAGLLIAHVRRAARRRAASDGAPKTV